MRITAQGVSKRYGAVAALDSFSLDMESGGVFGLVGPNGAGKSTFMKILATLERADSGQVLLDKVDISKKPDAMRAVLGYLPQDIAVYPNLTAPEFLEYIASVKGLDRKNAKKQANELLELLHLGGARKRRLEGYSGGMRQRVGIACALLGDPQIIVADEPSTGLDPEERIALRKLFVSLAKSRVVLLSTHIISDIESTASRMAVIKSGKLLFEGSPQELLKRSTGGMEEAYLQIVHEGEGAFI